MTSQRKFFGAALAVAAGLTALSPATAAFAQRYDSYGDARGSYDARRDYDAQYGPGAYDRYQSERRDYDARYGDGAYDRYYGAQSDRTYREERRDCHREKSGNAVAGGLLGGIAGAVIGSNVARGGGRTGGAIIGGVGGAALGSSIAKGQAHCDD